jgi:hypothetical protein
LRDGQVDPSDASIYWLGPPCGSRQSCGDFCGDLYRFRAFGASKAEQKNRFLPTDFSGISTGGATWRSGYAAVCKTVHPGSIPGVASSKINNLRRIHTSHKIIVSVTSVPSRLLFKNLTAAGLNVADARHLMYAACNGCDRFVTLDLEHFIGRRSQLEALCPGLKIVKPSEFVALLSTPSAPSAA